MQTIATTKDYALAHVVQTVVHVWHNETTLEGVASLSRAVVDAGARRPCSLLVVLPVPHVTPPSAEARAAISNMMRTHAPCIRAIALVHGGRGFVAATVRAVVAGLTSIAGYPFLYEVFPDTHAALSWLASQSVGNIADFEVLRRQVDGLTESQVPAAG